MGYLISVLDSIREGNGYFLSRQRGACRRFTSLSEEEVKALFNI